MPGGSTDVACRRTSLAVALGLMGLLATAEISSAQAPLKVRFVGAVLGDGAPA
jgi:hypothetical protein